MGSNTQGLNPPTQATPAKMASMIDSSINSSGSYPTLICASILIPMCYVNFSKMLNFCYAKYQNHPLGVRASPTREGRGWKEGCKERDYFLISFLGRSTQRLNSPMKATPAKMASI